MNLPTIKVIVIHDDLGDDDPLMIELANKYGKENVLLIKNSDEGLDYVLNHLSQKMVVILDLKFKGNGSSGAKVFQNIRNKTSLIYVILWTASLLNDIDPEDLKAFINNNALALLSSTDSMETILKKVSDAEHQLDTRVDSALEQWISLHPESEKNEPYVMTRTGESFSLNQILDEIRRQTTLGTETEKDILLLAIDMLARGKKKING